MTNVKRPLIFLAAALGASASLLACGGNKPVNPSPPPLPDYDAGAMVPAYDAGPPAAVAAADGWSGNATRIDPTMAALATGALAQVAGTEAPGMQPEGTLGAANFTQGQSLEHVFQMIPGKCYTVVGVGAGIQQLDIAMTVVSPLPGFNPPPFGVNDKKTTPLGSQSVLGSKTKCVKLVLLPAPLPVKFTITATKGQGLAAAQLFSK